jgi:type IV secretory pathway TrbF-like protein
MTSGADGKKIAVRQIWRWKLRLGSVAVQAKRWRVHIVKNGLVIAEFALRLLLFVVQLVLLSVPS